MNTVPKLLARDTQKLANKHFILHRIRQIHAQIDKIVEQFKLTRLQPASVQSVRVRSKQEINVRKDNNNNKKLLTITNHRHQR